MNTFNYDSRHTLGATPPSQLRPHNSALRLPPSALITPHFLAVFAAISAALTSFAAGNLAEAKKEYADRLQELRVCAEDVFEAKRAEMIAFIQKPGITNADQHVEFLLGTVNKDAQGVFEKPDCWELAEKVAAADPGGRRRLVSMKMWAFGSYFNGRGFSERRWSPEARLVFAEGLLNDPDFYSMGRSEKLEALKALGKYDEFVVFANSEIAKAGRTNEKIDLLFRLAEFHKASARRYYDKPEPSELKKAVAVVEQLIAVENAGKDRNVRKALMLAADASFQLEDYSKAKSYLAKVKEYDNDKFTVDCGNLLAKVAYAEEDYGTAADLWLESVKIRGGVDKELLVRALYAADRKKEAIPFMEEMSKKGNKYKRDFYGYALKELLEEDGK